jgi:hypothetical protein
MHPRRKNRAEQSGGHRRQHGVIDAAAPGAPLLHRGYYRKRNVYSDALPSPRNEDFLSYAGDSAKECLMQVI